jgi:hypothetical protein
VDEHRVCSPAIPFLEHPAPELTFSVYRVLLDPPLGRTPALLRGPRQDERMLPERPAPAVPKETASYEQTTIHNNILLTILSSSSIFAPAFNHCAISRQ